MSQSARPDGALVEVRQVEDVAGLVGEDVAVGRALLEDRDEAAQFGAVGLDGGVEVDDLRRVRVDAPGVRIRDEVDEVVAAEVDLRIGRRDRVPQVLGPLPGFPVTLYAVGARTGGHPDPVLDRVGAELELPVGGTGEEFGGGREVIVGQLVGGGQRLRVREGQEEHRGVYPALGPRVGRVPAVDTEGVVGARSR